MGSLVTNPPVPSLCSPPTCVVARHPDQRPAARRAVAVMAVPPTRVLSLVPLLPGLLQWVSLAQFLVFASRAGVVQPASLARIRNTLRLVQGWVGLRDTRFVILIQVHSYPSGKAITARPLLCTRPIAISLNRGRARSSLRAPSSIETRTLSARALLDDGDG